MRKKNDFLQVISHPLKSYKQRCRNTLFKSVAKIAKNGFLVYCRGVLNRLLKIERKLRQLSWFTIVNF